MVDIGCSRGIPGNDFHGVADVGNRDPCECAAHGVILIAGFPRELEQPTMIVSDLGLNTGVYHNEIV